MPILLSHTVALHLLAADVGPGRVSGNRAAHVELAANKRHPYKNVNHRNDAGNKTGDSKVGGLNSQQLDKNYKGPVTYRSAPPSSSATPATPQRQ